MVFLLPHTFGFRNLRGGMRIFSAIKNIILVINKSVSIIKFNKKEL
jgi:hypothetical protein